MSHTHQVDTSVFFGQAVLLCPVTVRHDLLVQVTVVGLVAQVHQWKVLEVSAFVAFGQCFLAEAGKDLG